MHKERQTSHMCGGEFREGKTSIRNSLHGIGYSGLCCFYIYALSTFFGHARPDEINYLLFVLVTSYCTFSSLLLRITRAREFISEQSYKNMRSFKMAQLIIILVALALFVVWKIFI